MWYCPKYGYAFRWPNRLTYHLAEFHVEGGEVDNTLPPLYDGGGEVGKGTKKTRRVYAV